MRRLLVVGMLAAFNFSWAAAQNLEIIKARKDLLSNMGDATKEPGKMIKQEVPFDAATVKAALDVIIDKTSKLPDMFPEDSKTGGKTEALATIWQNKDDVVSRFKKLVAAAKAAKDNVADEFDFMETWPKVVGNCGACHKKYRAEKK